MHVRFDRLGYASLSAAVLALAGCGGGGGGGSPAAPATTDVAVTVVDGAIRNATVCLDKNANGKCDADETQGSTDASGKVTLAVPNGDVGKYPIVAMVGTNAVDADNGAVTTAYTMSTPADQTAVVSPLTTMVHQTMASTGATTAEAAKAVQEATGLTVSVFEDFTKVSAPSDGSISAATVARMLVVTAQKQTSVVAATVGTAAADGSTITQADLDKAIQRKQLELLPDIVTALSDPAVATAATAAAKEAALQAAAQTLVSSSGLSASGVATVVAINNGAAASVPTTAPAAGYNLRALTFTDASNYVVRVYSGSQAQNTPDASNNVRYVERRTRSMAGNVAKWGAGNDPWRNADLHWNGSAWVNCPINFENTSSVRDAQGNSTYNYCDGLETGKSNRTTFDIAGKTMAEVYAQVQAAGYTNLWISDPAVLGSTTFPTGSSLFYQSVTPLTQAIGYYPGGANSPAGFGNVVTQYSAAVSAGGVASSQAKGIACNAEEANTNGSISTTLEGLIASKTGTPCVYAQSSFTYAGVNYTSDTTNEWWGNSTVSLGKLGSAAVGSGAAPGFYTTNTLLRIAFTGSGTNPVTYYACKERFNNGSTRNCIVIGSGSYTITTLGDARVMTLSNPPLRAASLNYNRVFVERGGVVYFGYQTKPAVFNTARLNTVAATALLNKLGITPEDPSQPLALTAGSYQGSWDLRKAGATDWSTGVSAFISGTGSTSCQYRSNSSFFTCTLSITDPSTGAFTLSDNAGNTSTGSFSFMAGTASGTYHDTTLTPVDGSFVGYRR